MKKVDKQTNIKAEIGVAVFVILLVGLYALFFYMTA